jgi:hypothetical protein
MKSIRASKTIFFLIVLVFSGCIPWWNVSETYDPIFPEVLPIDATRPQDIGLWLGANIHYIFDDTNGYWQSPAQTYQWRSGDCEDFAILMMYMIRHELGGWPELAIGLVGGRVHAWVIYNGYGCEAQGGRDVTEDPNYILRETVSYGVTMWRSENIHRSIRRTE